MIPCLAQVSFELEPFQETLTRRNLWSGKVLNWSNLVSLVEIDISVEKNGQLYFSQRTESFMLKANSVEMSKLELASNGIYYSRDALKAINRNQVLFPSGTYRVCRKLRTADGSETELARDCREVYSWANEVVLSDSVQRLSFQPYGQITWQSNELWWQNTRQTQENVVVDLYPSLSWQGVPIRMQARWVGGHQGPFPQRNGLTFALDTEALRNGLREKLQRKAEREKAHLREQYEASFRQEEQMARKLRQQPLQQADSLENRWQCLQDSLRDLPRRRWLHQRRSLQTALTQKRTTLDSLYRAKGKAAQARTDSLQRVVVQMQGQLDSVAHRLSQLQALERRIGHVRAVIRGLRQDGLRQDFLAEKHKVLKDQNDRVRVWLTARDIPDDPLALGGALAQIGPQYQRLQQMLRFDRLQLGTFSFPSGGLLMRGAQINGGDVGIRLTKNWSVSASGGMVQPLWWNQPGQFEVHQQTPWIVSLGAEHRMSSWTARVNTVYNLTAAEPGSAGSPDMANRTVSMHALGASGAFKEGSWDWSAQVVWAQQPETAIELEQMGWQLSLAGSPAKGVRVQFRGEGTGAAYQDIGAPFIMPAYRNLNSRLTVALIPRILKAGVFHQNVQNRPAGFSTLQWSNNQYGVFLRGQTESGVVFRGQAGRQVPGSPGADADQWVGRASLSLPIEFLGDGHQVQFSAWRTQREWTGFAAPQIRTYQALRYQWLWPTAGSLQISAYQGYEKWVGATEQVTYYSENAYVGVSIDGQWFTREGLSVQARGGAFRNHGQSAYHIFGQIRAQAPVSSRLSLMADGQWGRQPGFQLVDQSRYLRIGLTYGTVR